LAVLAAVAAAGSRPSTGATVGLGLFAAAILYVCLPVAVVRAVATPQGLMLYGPLWAANVRWDRVAMVVAGDKVGPMPVRSPVLLLTLPTAGIPW
jgi:hypothetical protein